MSPATGLLPPTFTTEMAGRAGVSRRTLYRLRDTGEAVELSRGVFRLAGAPAPDYPDLLAISFRAPDAIICTVSAAVVHELTDEIPPKIQLAIARGRTRPRIEYPPTRVFTFDPEHFELGMTTVEAAPGESVRIYNAPRTVVDLMRLRNQIGSQVALTSLRRYIASSDARPGEMLDIARALGVFGPVQQAVEVVLAT